MIPQAVAEILQEAVVAHLSTSVDGVPHATPIWLRYRNSHLLEANVGAMTKQAANLERNPRICLSLTALNDPGKWVVIPAVVENIVEVTDTLHLDELAKRYLGRPRRNPEMPRRILSIRPLLVHWWEDEDTTRRMFNAATR